MVLPNFIVVGSQRSGSTYLHNLLMQHPEVYLPENKELQYFSDKYYKFQKVDLQVYSSFFSDYREQKAIGEITPSYMFHEWVPELLYKHLGSIKLIFLLRNPIDRAYSHYWHEVSKKREWFTFEEAVKKEKERISTDYCNKKNKSYVERGFYGKQLSNFLNYFRKENMLILFSEDLYKDPKTVLKQICMFLGIDPNFNFNFSVDKHGMPLPKYIRFFRKWVYIKYVWGKNNRIIYRIASLILNHIPTVVRKYEEMKFETKELLQQIYSEDKKLLEKILDKKPLPW